MDEGWDAYYPYTGCQCQNKLIFVPDGYTGGINDSRNKCLVQEDGWSAEV